MKIEHSFGCPEGEPCLPDCPASLAKELAAVKRKLATLRKEVRAVAASRHMPWLCGVELKGAADASELTRRKS